MEKVLGNHPRGLLFVLSAPAGTGKTTLVNRLTAKHPSIVEGVSFTTRPPREGEKDGERYFFISPSEFEQRIEQGDFLEHVELYGYRYGTSKTWVEQNLSKGKHVILVIDTQGAELLRGVIPAAFIFMKPPSLEELKRRLMTRRTECDDGISNRLEWAKHEMTMEKNYDYTVVNDDLGTTLRVLESIIIAEEHRNVHDVPDIDFEE